MAEVLAVKKILVGDIGGVSEDCVLDQLKTMEDDDDDYDEDVQQMKSIGTASNHIFSPILPQNKLRIRSQNLPRHLGSYHVI